MSIATATAGLLTRDRLGPLLRKYAIIVIFLGLIVVLSFASPAFLQPQNLINVVRQISVIGLLAIGVTVVIISTGIDLSLGSVLALASVVAASFAQSPDWARPQYPGLQLPVFAALGAGLGVGLLCGLINGALIAGFRIPPFIATLGMMTAARGVALIYSNGRPISGLKEDFNFIGQQSILGVPVPIIVLAVVAIGAHLMLNNTRFGRHVYAVGGNEQAARVSGLNLTRIKILIYAFAGLMAGLGGLVLSARIGSGQPTLGEGAELDAIAAAVIGGTSFAGGIGTIWGTLVGALIIGVINNGLDLLNVSPFSQQVVKGAIIVIAIIIDERKNR